MIITRNKVTLDSGAGNTGLYSADDLLRLLAQPTAVALQTVNIIVNISLPTEIGPIPASTEVTAWIAVGLGGRLEQADHLLALPCPPYCEELHLKLLNSIKP